MTEELKKLLNKLNNIEANQRFVERNYWLGNKMWYIGRFDLYINEQIATEKEIKEFLVLKKEFDGP